MEFHLRRPGVREVFAAKRTIRSATKHSCKRRVKIDLGSCTRTETVSLTICHGCTIWLSISVGFPGQSSQSEDGRKSAARFLYPQKALKTTLRSAPASAPQTLPPETAH